MQPAPAWSGVRGALARRAQQAGCAFAYLVLTPVHVIVGLAAVFLLGFHCVAFAAALMGSADYPRTVLLPMLHTVADRVAAVAQYDAFMHVGWFGAAPRAICDVFHHTLVSLGMILHMFAWAADPLETLAVLHRQLSLPASLAGAPAVGLFDGIVCCIAPPSVAPLLLYCPQTSVIIYIAIIWLHVCVLAALANLQGLISTTLHALRAKVEAHEEAVAPLLTDVHPKTD